MLAKGTKTLDKLTDEEAYFLKYDWGFWGRAEQLDPAGTEWHVWLLLAGRGFGKTRTGSEWVRSRIEAGRAGRVALIAPTAGDTRDVMVEGESGILACAPPHFRPLYEPSKRRLTWPNGALATLYSADEPERLRGPQHDLAWCDELAAWRYLETWDMLNFGLRLGQTPQVLVTTTPRPIPLIKEILRASDTHVTRGTTYDNAPNLAGKFLETVIKKYAGTRLGRQELDGAILEDAPGALWTREILDKNRVRTEPKFYRRIVVAVDPSGTKGAGVDQSGTRKKGGDDIGIVVAGLGDDGKAYVLDDCTTDLGPGQWGTIVAKAYHHYEADVVLGETNFGGDMVRHVIQSVDDSIAFKEVRSSRGKWLRAEPVAALYEQGRVHHVGSFSSLEDQMCLFTAAGYTGGTSPDRTDALVFALTDLMLDDNRKVTQQRLGV